MANRGHPVQVVPFEGEYAPHYVIVPLKGDTSGSFGAIVQKLPSLEEALRVFLEARDKRVPLVILAKEVRVSGEG